MRRTLFDLRPGQGGCIYGIDGDSSLKRRLIDMGIIPGTNITVSRIAPLGDPIEVRLRGYSLSLRKADACGIQLMDDDEARNYRNKLELINSERKKRAKELLERLDLTDAQHRRLSAYSTGMRQRLSLARALMHSPEILFLDEPTSGLDPESAQNVNTLIQELASDGTTIFLCTHQLRYAQEICTTYGLMNQGNLFATGNIEKLRSMVSDKVKVRVKASCIPEDMECEKIGEHTYDISVNSEEEIPLLVRRIVGAGGDLYQVSAEQLSLEEIYFSLIDKNHAETECGNL